MLRKRTRSHHKDHHMNNLMMTDVISESYFHSDISSQKHKNNSFLKVPGLFVGFNPKTSDADSVRSPTSPLDFRIFSNFGNPFRCPKSQNEGHQKSWNCSKVGLSIIDSLDDETKQPGKVIRSADKKNIVFGRQMSINCPNFCSHVISPKSLPKNVAVFPNTPAKPADAQKGNSDVVFEIGGSQFEPDPNENFRARSMDSGRYGSYLTNFGNRKSRFGSGNLVPENTTNVVMPLQCGDFGGSLKLDNFSGGNLSSIPPPIHPGTSYIGSIPASEIELSEDYTCVISHGPNPKVTHIFGDKIFDCHKDDITNFSKKIEDEVATPDVGGPSDVLASYLPNGFLKFCYSCKKELDGEDIYMYSLNVPPTFGLLPVGFSAYIFALQFADNKYTEA
ncbi:hypothetical protein DH2020_001969 [Rehmannia glutinosa]|uniref:FLZ-type domain-containing protein n=1 Tax=Rehmannia glutinosa TaxID=99300 RepID=A0ABR0XSS0_REHGL